MDVTKIMALLPHRYPFLLVDRVETWVPGESMTAIKNVTVNEPFFQGHFPDNPIMPGVLIMEALAQTSGVLEFATCEQSGESTDFLYVFASIDKAKFRRQVVPGDQLSLTVEVLSRKRNMGKVKGVATVDGKVVASAELMCAKQVLPA